MNAIQKIKAFRFQERWVPWALLAVAVLAYGVMVRSLGFYWDDWEILYLSTAAETPSEIFLFPFRPLHVLLDIFTVKLLGYNTFSWHLLMLAIRFLGGLVFWLLLKEIWPDKPARNAWAAMLFLVYPAFLQNSMSVAYRQHFTTALVYLLSVWLMVRAYNLRRAGEVKRFWLPFILSLLTGFSHLFIMEYFAALELWRPLILGLLIWRDEPAWRERLAKLMFFWLPYLVYTAGYVFWRLAFVQNQIDDPNQAVLLDNLRASPVSTLVQFIQDAFLDLRYLLFGSWVDTLDPELVNITSPVSMVVFVLMIASGVGVFWLMNRLVSKDQTENTDPKPWDALLLGTAGVVLGLAPAWVIGRHVFEGRYDTRFSIPALAGASLLVVAFLFYLIPNRNKAAVVLSVLLALGIGRQVHMTNQFRWDWDRQTRAYWQLYWRAPDIKPDTAILVNRSLSGYATTYPVGYAVNLFYAPEKINMAPDYWWFEIYESLLATRIDDLYAGDTIRVTFHNLDFRVPSAQTLVVNLSSADEPTRCIWLLDASDEENAAIPEEMRKLASLSDLNRIHPEPNGQPPAAIFGPEPAPYWCTYFQKAELAAQLEDWETINTLYTEIKARGLDSLYGREYLPFIRASIAAQAWNQAATQTLNAYQATKSLKPGLCVMWEKLDSPPADQSAFNTAFDKVNQELHCVGK